MYEYRQQYKSDHGGWYIVQPLGSVEIGLRGCTIWGNTLYVYGVENVQRNKNVPYTYYNMILGVVYWAIHCV